MILVACKDFNIQLEIEKQLKGSHISNYEFYYHPEDTFKPRIISWCTDQEREDVILYHIFKEEGDVFYIDIGSNDPLFGSVTKVLKDIKGANGINIEPQKHLWRQTCFERPDDINLNIGIGEKQKTAELFMQGGATTFVEKYKISPKLKGEIVEIDTLTHVCEKYLEPNREISFLKIDVEGYEKEVILGADLKRWRPKLILVESVNPVNSHDVHEEWEQLLFDNGYHYVCAYGVNRYYLSNEVDNKYDIKIRECEHIDEYYDIHSLISKEFIYK